jgi:hypothetical protein
MSTPSSGLNSPNTIPINADLAVSFAQKYLQQVANSSSSDAPTEGRFLERRRQGMATCLTSSLRSASAKAWAQTETLLAEEVVRHQIDASLIDPWLVSGGIYQVYKHAIDAYAQQLSPYALVTKVSPILGQARKQVTEVDPRAIGFVAMQYHYTGVQLMEMLPGNEQKVFSSYVKILDDHLYMPLHRAYQAAALLPPDSLGLQSVQVLMPMMSDIAERIAERVIQLYPRYRCYSGLLSNPTVRTSSVRDVEMFQVYMWVCLLEQNLKALEKELFPLCVMIYPTLNISWELIRLMANLLRKEVRSYLSEEQALHCEPYYEILTRIFSPEVFP